MQSCCLWVCFYFRRAYARVYVKPAAVGQYDNVVLLTWLLGICQSGFSVFLPHLCFVKSEKKIYIRIVELGNRFGVIRNFIRILRLGMQLVESDNQMSFSQGRLLGSHVVVPHSTDFLSRLDRPYLLTK